MAKDPVFLSKALSEVSVVLAAGVGACIPGTLLGYSGGWVKADADAQIAAELVCTNYGVAADTVKGCLAGVMYDEDAPYTAGNIQYLSATAGAFTATIPAASGTLTLLQRIGFAITTDTMSFDLRHPAAPYTYRITASVDPASASTDTQTTLDVTLTGVVAGDEIVCIPASNLETGVILTGAIAGTDKVTLILANATAGTINGGAKTWTFMVHRF